MKRPTNASTPDRRVLSRRLSSLAMLLLAWPAFAHAAEPPSAVARFACFAKASEDLSQPGGGPGGAHWNVGDVWCEVALAWPSAAPEALRLDAYVGQGRRLTLVGRAFVAAPNADRAKPSLPPAATLPQHVFFIPAGQVAAAASHPTRQRTTGAQVFSVRWVLEVQALGPRGPVGKRQQFQVRADLAWGE